MGDRTAAPPPSPSTRSTSGPPSPSPRPCPPGPRWCASPSPASSTTSCTASTARRSPTTTAPPTPSPPPSSRPPTPAGPSRAGTSPSSRPSSRSPSTSRTTSSRSATRPRCRPSPSTAAVGGSRFADTMVMSTYLVAFIVGPLVATDPVDVDGIPLRVVHRAGQEDLTAFALESGAFALRYFAEYFGRPYPGRQARPGRGARLRLRGHGEPRLRHLPRRPPAASTPSAPPRPSSSGSPTSSTTRSPTCGSATW